ncbi:PQQ-binding-like beta-propeller repeat protein [Haloarchaeobius sp. DYHT-AS-18]|uniref:outer membrane protein assembly factor BamB family protein n=1 Tax=Haloarchaeobius sp. DYHT-AS-18 TaxID=3446117 RepID=UPI003EBEFF14
MMRRRTVVCGLASVVTTGCLRLEGADEAAVATGDGTGGEANADSSNADEATTGTTATTTDTGPVEPRPVWEHDVQGTVGVADGETLVTAGSDDIQLRAVADGERRWRQTSPVEFTDDLLPLLTDEFVYVAGHDRSTSTNVLTKYRRGSGTIGGRASIEHDSSFSGVPSLVDGLVVVGTDRRIEDDTLLAFDAETLDLVWSGQPVGDRFVGATAVDGTLYAGFDHYLGAFSLPEFTTVWADESRGVSGPPVARDGTLYVPGDGGVHAIDLETSDTRWSADLGGLARSATLVGDTLLVGGESTLSALDLATGSIQWQQSAGAEQDTPLGPALVTVQSATGTAWAAGESTITGVRVATGDVVAAIDFPERVEWVDSADTHLLAGSAERTAGYVVE